MKTQTYNLICQKCGKEYSLELTESRFLKGKYKHFCSRSCANTRRHSTETKEKIKNSIKQFINENNSLGFIHINNENKIKPRICEFCGKEFIPNINIKNNGKKVISHAKTCSIECKSKLLSLKNKLAGNGGFKENSVKSYKYGTYNGIHCDSSWELAFVIWNLEHNNKIERCKEIRTYIENDIKKLYYPDFIVNDSIIYEIKGIKNQNSILKQQYNQDIKFLYRNDMKKYLNYVENKYGKDYIKLYNK